MSLKDIINKILEKIGLGEDGKSEDEFNATLDDHEIEEQKYYRLHYLNYYNIGESYGYHNMRGETDWACKPFELPNGMLKNDAFKVLSYLTDFIEKCSDMEEASLKSVRTLDSVLDIERFGFKRLNFKPNEEDIIDLFTVGGRIKRFKSSKYYSKYFDWYIPNVRKDEVEEIYEKCGMTFRDIVFLDEEKKTEIPPKVIDSDRFSSTNSYRLSRKKEEK